MKNYFKIFLLLFFISGFSQIRNVKSDSIQLVEIPCPYKMSKDKSCPVCKKSDKAIPIVYGLLAEVRFKDKEGNSITSNGLRITSEDLEEKKKYKSGGCIVRDCQPTWFCERDEKEF